MGVFSTLESILESTSGLIDAIGSLNHKCLESVLRDQMMLQIIWQLSYNTVELVTVRARCTW